MSDSSTTMTSSRDEARNGNEKFVNNKKLTSYFAEIVLNLLETLQEDDHDYEMIQDSVFNSANVNASTINELLDNFVDLCETSETSLIIAQILLDRFVKTSSIKLSIYNIHKILISAILISIKYNEDSIYDNSFYAKVSNLSLIDINSLELNFIKEISYNIHVTEKEFNEYTSRYKKQYFY